MSNIYSKFSGDVNQDDGYDLIVDIANQSAEKKQSILSYLETHQAQISYDKRDDAISIASFIFSLILNGWKPLNGVGELVKLGIGTSVNVGGATWVLKDEIFSNDPDVQLKAVVDLSLSILVGLSANPAVAGVSVSLLVM